MTLIDVDPLLNELRLEGSFIDAVLKVGDAEFPVHRIVLCCHSEYFRTLFKECSNPEQKLFHISGLCSDNMQQILDFMYTGSMFLTENNVQEIMIAAEQYNIKEVVQACYEFITGMLNPNNCIGIWKFTNLCFHTELRFKAFDCILEHFEEVVSCDEVLLLTEEELSDVVEAYMSSMLNREHRV